MESIKIYAIQNISDRSINETNRFCVDLKILNEKFNEIYEVENFDIWDNGVDDLELSESLTLGYLVVLGSIFEYLRVVSTDDGISKDDFQVVRDLLDKGEGTLSFDEIVFGFGKTKEQALVNLANIEFYETDEWE